MQSSLFRALLFNLSLASAALAQNAPVAVTDFRSGPANGIYSFASSTPATVADLMQPSRPRPAAVARGELVLPATPAKVPVVVLVHGSGGVYPEEVTYWAKLFNDQGIGAFVLDVFGARGVTSTAEDQNQVPFAADTADAFAALNLLATHPRVDAGRIAVMGFSRGGTTAIRSAVLRVASGASPGGARFAAHLALYSGGCAGILAVTAKPGVFGPAPMLFIHGDADDYTYMSDCRSYSQRIVATGTPASMVVIPGARHKFDVNDTRRVNARFVTKTKEGCPLEYDVVDLTVRDRRSGEAVSQDKAQALSRELCADKGATLEGDNKARDIAGKAVMEFLGRALKS